MTKMPILPPQAGMVLKGLAAITGCASPTGYTKQEPLYRKGTEVCLVTGSTTTPVILHEDVDQNSGVVMAKFPDGRILPVDPEYLLDWSQCQ